MAENNKNKESFFSKYIKTVCKFLPIFLPFTIAGKLNENKEAKKAKKESIKKAKKALKAAKKSHDKKAIKEAKKALKEAKKAPLKKVEKPKKESLPKKFRNGIKSIGNTIDPLSGKHGILTSKNKNKSKGQER